MKKNITIKFNGITKNNIENNIYLSDILKNYNLNYNNIYITHNNKLISNSFNISNLENNSVIYINNKLNGGILDAIDEFIKRILYLFETTLD